MEANKYNDNNVNNFDFEVLTYSSSKDISNINSSHSENKEPNPENILKQNLNSLIRNIHNIIFDSRDYRNNFCIKSKKNLDLSNNGFVIGLDEALMDKNDFLENNKITNKISIEKRNYILEFYLINPKNKNRTILVEKWKMGYIIKDNNNNNLIFVKKKFDIIEKTIITLTRVLPLYNLLKTKKYIIEFKSFQDNKKKSQRFNKKPSSMELFYPEFFDLKIKIEYLNKNEIISDFENKLIKFNTEIRNKIPSVDFNQILQKKLVEKNENLMIKQTPNKSTFDMRNIIDNIIKNNNTDSESSSSDYENCNEVFQTNSKIIKTNITKKDLDLSCLSQYKTEYCTPRDRNNQKNNNNNLIKNSNIAIKSILQKNIKNTTNSNINNSNNSNNINNVNKISSINNITNIKINNIIGTFQRCKKIIEISPHYDSFNKEKLRKFVFDT